MPFDLHVLGVVHLSPVKVVICIESLGLSEKIIFRDGTYSDQDCPILPN